MAADVTGKWNATATVAEGQEHKLEMTFRNEGGKLTGALSSDEGGTDLQDVQLQGDQLTFKIPARGGYDLKFTVKGDSMTGTFTSAQGRTGKVTASRVAEKPAVAGHWKAEAKTASGQPYSAGTGPDRGSRQTERQRHARGRHGAAQRRQAGRQTTQLHGGRRRRHLRDQARRARATR